MRRSITSGASVSVMAFEPFIAPPQNWATSYAGLTIEQAAGIGAVAYTWSIAEAAIEMVLGELAQSPSALGQALTIALGPDNRLQALRRLCATWRTSLNDFRKAELGAIDEIDKCVKWITANKGRRNQIVHYLWHRTDDSSMLGRKHDTRPLHTYEQPVDKSISFLVEDLLAFANEINGCSDRLFAALREVESLPAWPRKHVPPPDSMTQT